MSLTTTTKVISQSSLSKLVASGSDVEVYDGWRFILNKTYMSESSGSSESIVAIPDDLKSVQTLKFLGFTDTAAEITFKRFQRAQSEWPDEELISYAKGTVRAGNDAVDEDDDWDEAMRSMGIDDQLRGRILNTRYTNIRLTETAMYWVIDTITDLYEFLISFNTNMDNSETVFGRPVSLASRMASGASVASSSATPKAQPESKMKGKGGLKSKSHAGPEPQVSTKVDERIVQADETILLKGGSLSRLNRAINTRKDIAPVISLNQISSQAPTDFSGDQPYWYFTKQKAVAEMYASWAMTRSGDDRVETGILSVIIPNDPLKNAVEIYGNDFKRFAWTNRLNLYMPEELEHYTKSEVLIGPIISSSTTNLTRMFDSGEDFLSLELLRLNSGDSATQFCILSRDLILKINERGRCWVARLELREDK